MKRFLNVCFCLLIVMLSSITLYSQDLEFSSHVIAQQNGEIQNPSSLVTSDLDSDGDLDIIVSCPIEDKIVWYENDGSENFSYNVIAYMVWGASSVIAVDLDSDDDIDLISSAFIDPRIEWYENDGNQNFTTHLIATSDFGFQQVIGTDLDNDGDIDLISASQNSSWLENDGSENFETHLFTGDGLTNYFQLYAEDINLDGYMDILARVNVIYGFENIGNNGFEEHLVVYTEGIINSFYPYDIDVDGDIDLVTAIDLSNQYAIHEVHWYENTGDFTSFNQHIVEDETYGAIWVRAADLDNDDDIDLVSANFGNGSIYIYENEGNELFTTNVVTSGHLGINKIYPVDLDNDDDIDIISVSGADTVIVWYENLLLNSPTNDSQITETPYSIFNYPNPFNPNTVIEFNTSTSSLIDVKIYNLKGQLIKNLFHSYIGPGRYSIPWDGKDSNDSEVPTGVYFSNLYLDHGIVKTKKMLLIK